MQYELALQLKEAGFPQYPNRLDISESGCVHWGTNKDYELGRNHCGCFIMVPTLSELIEACGGRFDELWKSNYNWQSFGLSYSGQRCTGEGSTPEEAVANLYLALNKK